jgi:hypothetical protein
MNEYAGSTYIGVVGPEQDYSEAWRSIVGLSTRPNDSRPNFYAGTKGYELRQLHLKNFISSTEHDFILMLDHDMVFPADTLERLRSHKLPYVSGLYMRRQYSPIAPIWFEDNPAGDWPQKPYMKDPERGQLHKIAASGWGCVLIHREVILAVRALLHGEWEVIEDDMDVWPYDLNKVIRSLRMLERLAGRPLSRALERPIRQHVNILSEQIRPLRGTKDPIGSDIRFPFFAKHAGYQLWGDPDVRPNHMLHYQLSPDDFTTTDDEYRAELLTQTDKKVGDARQVWREIVGGLGS